MIKLPNDELHALAQQPGLTTSSLSRLIAPLHWTGYTLLILASCNFFEILVPPSFLNPTWEFQAMGAIVDQAPLVLLGFSLTFLCDRYEINRWERFILKCLSWIILLIALAYLLMIPLSIIDTARVDQQTKQQITVQVVKKKKIVQRFRDNLNKIKTVEEMKNFIDDLNNVAIVENFQSSQQLEEMKETLVSALNHSEKQLDAQAQAARSEQRLQLHKKSLKWNLEALVSGLLLIIFWQHTSWFRRG